MSCRILFLFTNILLIANALSFQTIGPADIHIESMDECKNPESYQLPMTLKMNKINRTHAGYTGCIEFPGELGADTALNLTAEKWGDGGWKPNAFNFYSQDVCKTLEKQVSEAWYNLLEKVGHKDQKCPLPKDKYCVDKVTFDLNSLFPSMLYGKFRVEFGFYFKRAPYLCIRGVINSVPSKRA